MRRPERQFWIYISLLSGIFLLLTSGQLISCAKAETTRAPRHHHRITEPSPWNEPNQQLTGPGPSVESRPGVRLRAQLDRGAVLRHSDGTIRVEVNVEADADDNGYAPEESDMVVVVDTSGSMEGQKLHFAQEALLALLRRLSPGDRFALVEYSSYARVLTPLVHVTEDNRRQLENLAYGLQANGSTNMSEGLDSGIRLLNQSSHGTRPGRVLLLSDGLANAGDSSLYGLTQRARTLAQRQFALTTMGIGDDFDENVMTTLATAGSGAFYYLSKLNYLAEFFDAELNSARNTYARAGELRFSPAYGVTLTSAMGLPLSQSGQENVIQLGNIYASRTRTVWLTLRVPTHALGTQELGRLSLSYQRHGSPGVVSVGPLPRVACLDDRVKYEQNIHKPIWERAMLDDVFTETEESFGDAIRTGDRGQLNAALKKAEDSRALATRLGSTKVVQQLDELNEKAGEAAVAQSAPAAVRAESAKKSKASGYQMRNKGAYDSVDRARMAY